MASTPLNKTASTHRSTLVRGKHQFHIVGYSERKALAGVSARNTSVVRSGDFEAGGCTWAISCRFRKHGLASISLELVSGKYAATAMASLRIEDPLHRWPAACRSMAKPGHQHLPRFAGNNKQELEAVGPRGVLPWPRGAVRGR